MKPRPDRMTRKQMEDALSYYEEQEKIRALTYSERDRQRVLVERLKRAEATARYRARNDAKVKAAMADWRARNKEKNNKKDRQRYRDNPEHYARKARAWREANPEKVKIDNDRKNARRRALAAYKRFLGEIASALGCKLLEGRLEPLEHKDRRKPLMLPAPVPVAGLDAPLAPLGFAPAEQTNVVELPTLNGQDLGNVPTTRKVA